MKLLFLRGHVPNDQNPKNIMADSLDSDCDMWTHLANALGDERCEIVYLGGKRNVAYNEKCAVLWAKDADHINLDFTPTHVFARGGFNEWNGVVKRFPNAKSVYYGSGVRVVPETHNWNVVLADTKAQEEKLRAKGFNPLLWVKPCLDCFRPIDIPKTHDLCFVGDGRFPFRAKIKRVNWVYRSIPKHLTCLHMGWRGEVKPPNNITVNHVHRRNMPVEYNRCKLLIAPYDTYDSAPRVIPEALACGLKVVAMNTVNFNNYNNAVTIANKNNFWSVVEQTLNSKDPTPSYISFSEAVEHLKRLL